MIFDPERKLLVVPAVVDSDGAITPELPAGVTDWVGNLIRPDLYLILTTDPADVPRAGPDFDPFTRAQAVRNAASGAALRSVTGFRLANDIPPAEWLALQSAMGSSNPIPADHVARWAIRGI